jgi:TolA-binding protein
VHVKPDTPSAAVQPAPPQMTHLEETCVRMIQEVHALRGRVAELQGQSNAQLQAVRDEVRRRQHAERMQAAVELRLDDLANQNEELLTALEGLVEVVDMPQTFDQAVLVGMRFEAAKKIVELYGAKGSETGVAA